MKLQNFLQLYAALVYPEGDDQLDLAFKIFCSSPPDIDADSQEEYVRALQIQQVGIKKLGQTQSQVVKFMNDLGITKDRRIFKSEFKDIFSIMRQNPMFTWLDDFNYSFNGIQNAQESVTEAKAKQEKQFVHQGYDFTPEEYSTLENFFEQNIANQTDLQKAKDQFIAVISDRSIHMKLRDRLIESFLYASSTNFYEKKVFFENMRLMLKERDDFVLMNFIFDIFTKYSKDGIMSAPQIRDVFSVFRKQITNAKKPRVSESSDAPQMSYFSTQSDDDDDLTVQIQHLDNLRRETFIDCYIEYLDHQDQFSKIRTILNIEFGVRPETSLQEKEVIYNTLDQTTDLQKFAVVHMQKGDGFYLVNKKFWDQWNQYVKSGKTKKDAVAQFKIDNESIVNAKDKTKKKIKLKLDENVVVMPPRLWNAFQKWYGKSVEIRRNVISYPNTKENVENQSKHILQMTFGVGTYNLRKLSDDHNYVIELEIELIMIQTGMLQENGSYPETHYPVNISPKMTLHDVKVKLCKKFQLADEQKTQLWMQDQLISEDVLFSLVEQNKEIKDGMKFYIEQMLENKRWPSDERIIKKNTQNSYYNQKTVGCYNLGNTCYINSVIQCVANTHYFKEYFLSNLKSEDTFQQIVSNRTLYFRNHINHDNPMGFQGQIVKPFAKLIEDLYTSKFACAMEPKKFKAAMSQFHQQFSGNQQQDAQEFLVILLDSIHEELNLRLSRPYIEKPSSQNRNENELAIECWSNFLHRNWSIISFLFYGQMRSHLQCSHCGHTRISFDEFSTLSLPLPESSMITFKIIISLLPTEIKFILEHREDVQKHLQQRLEFQRRKETFNFEVQETNIQSLTKERPIILSITMNPTQQVHEITDFLAQNFPNLNLLKKERKGIFTLDNCSTEVVYYLMSEVSDSIHIIIPPNTYLNQIRDGTYIYASELLTSKGKQWIQEFHMDNLPELQAMKRNFLLNFKCKNFTYEHEQFGEGGALEILEKQIKDERSPDIELVTEEIQCVDDEVQRETINNKRISARINSEIIKEDQIKDFEQNWAKLQQPKPISDPISEPQRDFFDMTRPNRKAINISVQQSIDIDTQYYEYAKYQLQQPNTQGQDFNAYWQNIERAAGQLVDKQVYFKPPSEYLVFFINRKIVQREVYLIESSKYTTKTFGKPYFAFVDRMTTGRMLYEEVWMKTRFMLNFTQGQFFADPQNLWWNKFETDEERILSMRENTQFSPFVLKFVRNINSEQQLCSICMNPKLRCFGCIVEPDTKLPLYEILKDNSFFAIDWNIEFLQQYFQPTFLKPIEHESLKDSYIHVANKKITELTDCLKMFQNKEEIPLTEGVMCEQCHEPTHHTRKMGISKAPPILIIHLKRFKIINYIKRKIDQYIHYPLYDLDMGPFMAREVSDKGPPAIYDLYGVINHFGEMNHGHYTCFIKNERSGNWLQYDDSYVKEVGESKIRSQFGYILFYQRRDVIATPIQNVLQSITFSSEERSDWFRGKPVRLKQKYGSKMLGYIWNKREATIENPRAIYHIKFGTIDFFTTLDMLDFEEDLDDLSFMGQGRLTIAPQMSEVQIPAQNGNANDQNKKSDQKQKSSGKIKTKKELRAKRKGDGGNCINQ